MIAVKRCGKIASGTKNSVKLNLIRSLGCLAVSIIVCLFSGFERMNTRGITATLLSGVANGVLLWSWILAASCAPMITVEVFCMIGGVVIPLLLSPILLVGESVGILQWIGSALLFCAMFCLSAKRKIKSKIQVKSILLMCTAGLANAGCVMSQKLYTSYNGGTVADFQLGTYAVTAVVLAMFFGVMRLLSRGKERDTGEVKITKPAILYLCAAFILTYAAQLLSTLSSARIPSAVLYPLSYVISMPLVFAVDIIIFKEKITLRGIIGLLLICTSGILINL